MSNCNPATAPALPLIVIGIATIPPGVVPALPSWMKATWVAKAAS